jgi:CopG family nickel-responsive transcriptional regulator
MATEHTRAHRPDPASNRYTRHAPQAGPGGCGGLATHRPRAFRPLRTRRDENAAMKRLTMSLDDDLADAFDALVRERGYENRSEAFRDLLRHDLGQLRRREQPDGPCVATLSYLYNHHQRQLAMRLTDMQHEHHGLTVATTHAHLDHDHCIETMILRGRTDEVQAFAESVIAQPGVSHGQLHLVPVAQAHGHAHPHEHPYEHADGDPRQHEPAHGHAPAAPAARPGRAPGRR